MLHSLKNLFTGKKQLQRFHAEFVIHFEKEDYEGTEKIFLKAEGLGFDRAKLLNTVSINANNFQKNVFYRAHNPQMVAYLIENGANIYYKRTTTGGNIFECFSGNPLCVSYLLEQNIHKALYEKDKKALSQILYDLIETTSPNSQQQADNIKKLLDFQPTLLNEKNKYQMTPLIQATTKSQVEICRLLIGLGANLHECIEQESFYNHKETKLETALTIAALMAQEEVVNLLLHTAQTPLDIRAFEFDIAGSDLDHENKKILLERLAVIEERIQLKKELETTLPVAAPHSKSSKSFKI